MVTPRHYSSKFGSAANAVNGFSGPAGERIERMQRVPIRSRAVLGNGLKRQRIVQL